MNLVGTIASGWVTDRYDPRKLLAIYYYTGRGLLGALMALGVTRKTTTTPPPAHA